LNRSLGRRLFAHGVPYAALRVANVSIGFVLIPLYARYLGSEGYGVVALMATLGAFLTLFFAQGLHAAFYRLNFEEDSQGGLRRLETSVVYWVLASGALGLVLLAACGETLARWVTPGIPFFPLGFWTALGAAAGTFALLYERKLQAEQDPAGFLRFGALRGGASLAAIVLFVAVLGRGAAGKIEAEALVACGVAALALRWMRPGSPRMFSPARMAVALAYALPLLPHTLLVLTNDLADRLLVNLYLGTAVLGVYALGYKLCTVVHLVGQALVQAYGPLYIRARKEAGVASGGDVSPSQAVGRAGLLLVAATAACALCVTAGARELVVLLAPTGFERSWSVVAPVAAGFVALAAYGVFNQPILYDLRGARRMVLVSGGGAACNVVANLLLLPALGLMGAAWSTLLSCALMAWLAVALSGRHCVLRLHPARWSLLFASAAAALAALWCVDARFSAPGPGLAWKAPILLCGLAAVAASAGVSLRSLGRFVREGGTWLHGSAVR
jgi:O-antigen/teichoic acid export membrane protein